LSIARVTHLEAKHGRELDSDEPRVALSMSAHEHAKLFNDIAFVTLVIVGRDLMLNTVKAMDHDRK
jgi:hypothetical protein